MPPQQGVPLAKPFLSPSQMHLDDHRADHHHQDVADVKDAGDAKANVKILQELEEQALSKYWHCQKKRGGALIHAKMVDLIVAFTHFLGGLPNMRNDSYHVSVSQSVTLISARLLQEMLAHLTFLFFETFFLLFVQQNSLLLHW